MTTNEGENEGNFKQDNILDEMHRMSPEMEAMPPAFRHRPNRKSVNEKLKDFDFNPLKQDSLFSGEQAQGQGQGQPDRISQEKIIERLLQRVAELESRCNYQVTDIAHLEKRMDIIESGHDWLSGWVKKLIEVIFPGSLEIPAFRIVEGKRGRTWKFWTWGR